MCVQRFYRVIFSKLNSNHNKNPMGIQSKSRASLKMTPRLHIDIFYSLASLILKTQHHII